MEPKIPGQSVEYPDASSSDRGRQTPINASKILAMTAYAYSTSAEMRKQVTPDFSHT